MSRTVGSRLGSDGNEVDLEGRPMGVGPVGCRPCWLRIAWRGGGVLRKGFVSHLEGVGAMILRDAVIWATRAGEVELHKLTGESVDG